MTETAPAKRHWTEIAPADAVDIKLPRDDIEGPYNEFGKPCPWPWDPQQLVGAPLGQYHCPYCGSMCMAGLEHPDYREDSRIDGDYGWRAELAGVDPSAPVQVMLNGQGPYEAVQLMDDLEQVAAAARWATSCGVRVDEPFLPDARHVLTVHTHDDGDRIVGLGDWIARLDDKILVIDGDATVEAPTTPDV